jgi:hypothetical protein
MGGIELIPQTQPKRATFFLLERRTIMSENKLISGLKANVQESKGEEPRQDKGAYRAPRLVVLGTAVELVQGYTGHIWDVRGNSHM